MHPRYSRHVEPIGIKRLTASYGPFPGGEAGLNQHIFKDTPSKYLRTYYFEVLRNSTVNFYISHENTSYYQTQLMFLILHAL